MLLISAFILGLAGNFHCLGMCGPIALAIPIKNDSTFTRFISILLYNLGRVFTYTLLGAVLGFLGRGASLMGYQQKLSIFLGIGIIIYALFTIMSKKTSLFSNLFTGNFFRLKNAMGGYLRTKSYDANLMLGLLNGLLPCGMIYIALAGALATGSVLEGIGFMFFFGLGTLPVMMVLPWIKSYLSATFRVRLQQMIPYTLLLFGMLLLLRGFNLGIPYLSPQKAPQEMIKSGADYYCH